MHYSHPALRLTQGHPVTVDLIGVGGTGSAMLTHLARIHKALEARGHLGLHVRVFDGDHVEAPNLGRQHFTQHDLGRNKAEVATERVNAFFGFNWQAMPYHWGPKWLESGALATNFPTANIVITCVDSAAARQQINERIRSLYQTYGAYFDGDGWLLSASTVPATATPLYWLDIGNGKRFGQVILGSWFSVPQPHKCKKSVNNKFASVPVGKRNTSTLPLTRLPEMELIECHKHKWNPKLPTVLDLFPDLAAFEDDEAVGPSCSLVEALEKQSLMINPMMAGIGATLLLDLFEKPVLTQHGAFLNLETYTMTPLMVPPLQPDFDLPLFWKR